MVPVETMGVGVIEMVTIADDEAGAVVSGGGTEDGGVLDGQPPGHDVMTIVLVVRLVYTAVPDE